jgi:threonine aldolase
MIDLRSDTVTRPTLKMRDRISRAVVGDDVMEEDELTIELQNRVANMFHKEAALFFPSGTMSNLASILTWCDQRGSEIIVGDKSHISLFEQSGASQFGGVSIRTVPNLVDGTMDLDLVKSSIRENDIHEPITKLICIENTHNVCGGTIIPLTYLKHLHDLTDKVGIPIHLDGARLWNAITEMEVEPYVIGELVDSLTVCLSKGLGAPVGSLLVGSRDFIRKARRIRKALGGGMRQVGILAAAGLQALDDFESNILKEDHCLTKRLANRLLNVPYLEFDIEKIQTNIIFANVKSNTFDAYYVAKICKEHGVLISAWSPTLIRIVLHRDIHEHDLPIIINTLKNIDV